MKQHWKAFLRWFRSAVRFAWPYVEPATELALKRYGKLIFIIAEEAANIAEQPNKSGSEKFDEAFGYITKTLEAQGKQIFVDSIRFAIEAAVASLKK
jgi:hypothetical protein